MIESWHDFEPFLDVLGGPRPRHGRARRLHRALASRAHPRRRRSVPGAALRDRAPRRGARAASATGRSATRASRRPASRGSARTSSTTSTTCTRAACDDVLVCPVGFVSDHLEIRWDIDVEAQERARELGMTLQTDRDAERRPRIRARARVARRAGAGCSCASGEIQRRPRRLAALPRLRARGTNTLKSVALLRSQQPARPDVWALRDVSFAVEPGSGSRSSAATARARARCSASSPGSSSRRRAASTSAAGSARCSSSAPASIPDFTGRENVYLNGSILGLKRAYIRERFDEIVAFAELEDFIDVPVRTYSSGMFMRLGFAVASHLNADVLLLDEVFAVGDGAFQRKCLEQDPRLQAERRHDRVRLARRVGGRAPVRARDPAARGQRRRSTARRTTR